MRDFSTQSARPDVEREELEFDVLFVGGGPANLTALWRLLDLIKKHNEESKDKKLEGLTIGLIEKADEVGEHAFSGAVLDPIALQELCPNYIERGFPTEGSVEQEEVWLFRNSSSGFKLPILPPFFKNHGSHIVSLSKMTRWMAQEIESREIPGVDIMLLPGFAGIQVLWEEGKVAGVQTADKGVDQDGSPRSNFEPGNKLKAKVTVFGEGPRGHLQRELSDVLGLQKDAINPQVFETGAKEIWEIPEGRVSDGFVMHSAGWPLKKGDSGGSFIYKMSGNKLAIGYVISLDTKDPYADAHQALQTFKTHDRIKAMLEGGKMIQYGAKALAIGGLHSMPRLAFDGGMLVGDAAQMVNAARLKGIHLAMKGGLEAAGTILDALQENDFSEKSLMRYSANYLGSWAGTELKSTRNFHQIVAHGLNPIAAARIGVSLVTSGWVPCDPMKGQEDHTCTGTLEAVYGKAGISREEAQPPVKQDGQLVIQKLDDVYLAGVMHDEHQPSHLKIVKGNEVCARCYQEKGAPCTAFCPAQVYEVHPDAQNKVEKVEIAFSNCVHCRTCDIKCPEQNVIWTPPEGGGGPKYTIS